MSDEKPECSANTKENVESKEGMEDKEEQDANESVTENPDVTLNYEECMDYLDRKIAEEDEAYEEAEAVLGGSDAQNCTYEKGYIKRQAIYSCLTCCPESKEDPSKRSGVCLACSLKCHENHDLVELYTKRNFRCDCGGAKMKSVRCLLAPIKFGINEDNKYNQNFSGLYCTCKRPYPDPEDTIDDEMIQCVICEDWYHGRHLNTEMVKDFSEMICGGCVGNHQFLKCYLQYASTKSKTKTSEIEDVDVVNSDGKREAPETSAQDAKRIKLDSQECQRPQMDESFPENSAVFWYGAWREKLCKCPACLEMYKKENVEFLIDPEDPVQKYEELGRELNGERPTTSEGQVMQLISGLDRVQQVDVITKYNDFKSRLSEFMLAYVMNGQTITAEDVHRFFDMLKNEKSKEQGLPYFCR